MDEATAARLELAGLRARTLLGNGAQAPASGTTSESTQDGSRPPDEVDARLIAARIAATSALDVAAARAVATEIVAQARAAVSKLKGADRDAPLDEAEALALESVIHVRGRPALRVYGNRLESLAQHPGSELWQVYIADYEALIVGTAAATGAVIVSSFESGNPPWLQGSAWLIGRDRVITNRHVLVSTDVDLLEPGDAGAPPRLRAGNFVTVELAADNRQPAAPAPRAVLEVLYLAPLSDPVDVAVLRIEPVEDRPPLRLVAPAGVAQRNLFVVGHPAPLTQVPEAVSSVFGSLDGRKRVSFGKRLNSPGRSNDLAYDASTVGGYSGGPVVAISSGQVVGLHYYGDPAGGNLAITAEVLRNHAVCQYL